MKLRDYQEEALDKIAAAFERGQYSGIVHFATGLGKTETAFGAFQRFVDYHRERAMFVAPARALIVQTAARARRALPAISGKVFCGDVHRKGIGVVMSSTDDADAVFVVGSVQTLVDRDNRPEDDAEIMAKDIEVVKRVGNLVHVRLSPHSQRSVLISRRADAVLAHGVPSLLMFDEAHHAVADNSYILIKRLQQVRRALKLPPLKLIGFTATPIRADGRGLINLFDRIYARADFRWGQAHGYLTPFANPIRVTVSTPLGRVSPLRVANWEEEVYKAYCQLASDRWCIAFTGAVQQYGGVEVSRILTRYFQARGVPCAQTDGESCILPDGSTGGADSRGVVYDAFTRGEIRVIFSFGVGLEGLDLPKADCLLWMRKTDNAVLRTQAVGRVLRPHPGKKDALIVDFTDKDIELEPIGTLIGYKIDPKSEQYVKEDDVEEADQTLKGEPFKKKASRLEGIEQHHEHARILTRFSHDWFESDGFYTLTVSENAGLIVVPPNYTLGEVAAVCSQDIERAAADEPNPYTLAQNARFYKFYERIKNPEERERLGLLLDWAAVFLNNYTLWEVRVNGFKADLKHNGFVEHAQTLEDILILAASYIDEQMTPAKTFVKRSARWKREKLVTEAQMQALRSLKLPFAPTMTAGEASQLISSAVMRKPIESLIARLESKLSSEIPL